MITYNDIEKYQTKIQKFHKLVEIDNKEVNIAEIANLWKVIEWEKSGELNE